MSKSRRRKQKKDKSVDASIERAVSERERGHRGTATVERLRKAGSEGHEIDPTGRQRIVEAPIDRMWKAGHVTQREFDAADKYRSDAYLAAIDPGALTVDWSRTSGSSSLRIPSMFTAQHIADARIRMRELERDIPNRSVVSTLLYLGLVKEMSLETIGANVFGLHDARDRLVAARAGLRVACASLADVLGS